MVTHGRRDYTVKEQGVKRFLFFLKYTQLFHLFGNTYPDKFTLSNLHYGGLTAG